MCAGPAHRVLIVDDSKDVRRALRRVLEEEEGITVVEAGDGLDGITQAKVHPPCAVVLDFSMPQMDGIETARRLSGLMPEVPLFLFTNYASHQLEQALRGSGIRQMILKTECGTLMAALKLAWAGIAGAPDWQPQLR